MLLKSMVTFAGGAAVWGMLLICVHLFWNPPSEMRPVAANSSAVKMKELQTAAGVSLQQVWCAFTQCKRSDTLPSRDPCGKCMPFSE